MRGGAEVTIRPRMLSALPWCGSTFCGVVSNGVEAARLRDTPEARLARIVSQMSPVEPLNADDYIFQAYDHGDLQSVTREVHQEFIDGVTALTTIDHGSEGLEIAEVVEEAVEFGSDEWTQRELDADAEWAREHMKKHHEEVRELTKVAGEVTREKLAGAKHNGSHD